MGFIAKLEFRPCRWWVVSLFVAAACTGRALDGGPGAIVNADFASITRDAGVIDAAPTVDASLPPEGAVGDLASSDTEGDLSASADLKPPPDLAHADLATPVDLAKPTTCFDTVADGDESDVDCGGSCATCEASRHCATAADCRSGLCTGGRCAAHLSLSSPIHLSTGVNAFSGAIGDYDGDGWPDVAVVRNFPFDDQKHLSIFVHSSARSLFLSRRVALGSLVDWPWKMAAADVNGDGIDDLVIPLGAEVKTVLNGAGGSALGPATPASSASFPVGAGDFDGDGLADLVFNDPPGSAPGTWVWKGSGTGSFSPQLYLGPKTDAIVVDDLDRDGHLDLAMHASVLDVRRGAGSMAFTPWTQRSASGDGLHAFAVADFDGDGVPDCATTDGQDTVWIYLGGGLKTQITLAGAYIYGLAAADLNLDGRPDLAIAGMNSSKLYLHLGVGDGTFSSAQVLYLSPGSYSSAAPSWVQAADLDRDGRLDLVVVNHFTNEAVVYWNNSH